MSRALLIGALAFSLSSPAFAQQHQAHDAPDKPAVTAPRPPIQPVEEHDHGEAARPPASEHAGHMSGEAAPPPEAGNEMPPDSPTDYAADTFYSKADMERARAILDAGHGGATVMKLMANEMELTRTDGEDGYRWSAEGWYGGDLNRFVFKTEGEGADNLEGAEVQALYSRAIGPYIDLQVGLRHDIEPNPARTYLAVGAEALLPYWFEAEGALFIGERSQVRGRLEGRYDFQLTQRLVLQPSAELNLALKDDPAIAMGSGLSTAEAGLRLRYEFSREFAPYIGVRWECSFGATADYARAEGKRAEATSVVVGLRAWY